MDIRYDKIFCKQYRKANKNIRSAFVERLRLFQTDSFHPFLHNHELTGAYRGYRSINVTGDWRALYMESRFATGVVIVEFKLFGTHSQLYKK
ncbi:type II toxin-antitoxin system mRNA interferase toxin, RelE/StbE family [Candidatus Gottesmanbacteria bacterium]|nr:type II toxin-antitoxin system mRNA interferase toxin, RelE/StbE family [Candidatus Gottesmanbacteria bacterium]